MSVLFWFCPCWTPHDVHSEDQSSQTEVATRGICIVISLPAVVVLTWTHIYIDLMVLSVCVQMCLSVSPDGTNYQTTD